MNLISLYREGDMATKLIFINSAVFLFMCVLMLTDRIMGTQSEYFTQLLFSLSSNFLDNIVYIWRWLTYMFLHTMFVHYIINMLLLSFAGKLFYQFWEDKDLLKLYIYGGLAGGVTFIAANLFSETHELPLCGASASIMALVFACAAYAPNYEVRLTLIGEVKIKWIAAMFLAVSMFNMLGSNWLGELSHLGGMLAGILFAYFPSFRRTTFMKREKATMKLYRNPNPTSGLRDARSNSAMTISTEEEMLDSLLDKIKMSGYDSLTDKEKKFLDGYGKRN